MFNLILLIFLKTIYWRQATILYWCQATTLYWCQVTTLYWCQATTLYWCRATTFYWCQATILYWCQATTCTGIEWCRHCWLQNEGVTRPPLPVPMQQQDDCLAPGQVGSGPADEYSEVTGHPHSKYQVTRWQQQPQLVNSSLFHLWMKLPQLAVWMTFVL